MTTAERAAQPKPMVCKNCTAAGKGPDRACDEPGCGRHCCPHLCRRTDGRDTCGACVLRLARAEKKGGAK